MGILAYFISYTFPFLSSHMVPYNNNNNNNNIVIIMVPYNPQGSVLCFTLSQRSPPSKTEFPHSLFFEGAGADILHRP